MKEDKNSDINIRTVNTENWNYKQSKKLFSPDWCGSVDWAPACKPKSGRFNSQSGHMLGLQAKSLVGGMREATTYWWFSPSLFLSPFPSL